MLENKPELLEVQSAFERLLRRKITAMERVGGGGNSRVYRIDCDSGESYAGKLYFQHPSDTRDRLGVEAGSLRFLWEHGVQNIPRPVAADPNAHCAIYEFIHGARISPGEIQESDVDNAVEFMRKLKELRNEEESRRMSAASEAFFSVKAVVGNIEHRFKRLAATDWAELSHSELHHFLANEFRPTMDRIVEWCRSHLALQCIDWTTELQRDELSLSPSDFGFHNALRRPDGQIVFLDFEYFGWDDPAKMISDFLLHPAMRLNDALRRRFVTGMLKSFLTLPHLPRRLELLYPLFGLKWCLIMLNEFVPADLLRRRFAKNRGVGREELLMQQLLKAQSSLAMVQSTYTQFPFHV